MVGIYGVSEPVGPRAAEALQRMVAGARGVHRGRAQLLHGPGVVMAAYPRQGEDSGEAVLDRDDVLVIVSGHLFHPKLEAEGPARLVGRLLDTGSFPEGLAECVGEFAAVLVDKRSGEVSLVTDYLGVRPLFYAITDAGVLFGTNVWPMFDSGRIHREVDYDSLASWIVFNYTQDTCTLFKAIRKVPAATLLRCRGRDIAPVPYVRPGGNPPPRSGSDLVEQINDIVSRTAQRLTRGQRSLAVLLSGGYDSRYVACLLKRQGLDCVALTVPYESGDAELTPVVANRLGMPLRSVPVPGSLDDAFGDPVRWSAFGFPVGKHVTCLPIERFGITVPAADGFIGDRLMRGLDYDGLSSKMLERVRRSESLPEAALRVEMLLHPAAAFAPALARRIWERAKAQTTSLLEGMEGSAERKATLWLLQNRKANWINNNHQQYLESTETLHPFYSRELIELHLGGARFTWALYDELFTRFYPEVADIRHSRHVRQTFHATHRWSWVHWRNAPGLVNDMLSADWARKAIHRGRVVPRVASYLGGVYRWAYLVRYVYQVATLMRRLETRGIEVDWKAL